MMTTFALLLLRFTAGGVLAAHGAQKLFGWQGGPGLSGWAKALASLRFRPVWPLALASALAEFAGGLLVAFGLLFPFAPLLLLSTLLVAIWAVHVPKGFWNAKGGYEFPLALALVALALGFTGPGAWSLDAVLGIDLVSPLPLATGLAALTLGLATVFALRRPSPTQAVQPSVR